LGFISNVEEEKYLLRQDTQELMATSIYNAFVEYKNLIEETTKPLLPITKSAANYTNNTNDVSVSEAMNYTSETNDVVDTDDTSATTVPLVPPDTSVIPDTPLTLVTKDSATNADAVQLQQPDPVQKNIRFRIQFFISKENINISDKRFSSLRDVKKYNENGTWKYTTGDFITLAEAQTALKEVKKKYADSFIIAFHNEKKITIKEAQELMR
jgi:N-acetylmuramoyl-L-alanine amidase